jgi:hypothetical protein
MKKKLRKNWLEMMIVNRYDLVSGFYTEFLAFISGVKFSSMSRVSPIEAMC